MATGPVFVDSIPNIVTSGAKTVAQLPSPVGLNNTFAFTSDQGLMVSNGTSWIAYSAGGGVANKSAATYSAARLTSRVSTGDTLYVFGRTSQSDGGQGLFTWVVGTNIYGDNDLRLTSTGGYWQRVFYDAVFNAPNPVGINLAVGGSAQLSFEAFPLFKNRVRESRGFTNIGGTATVALSAAGWPTADFSVILWEGNNPSWLQAGYAFACGFLTTTGTETIAARGGGTVTGIVRGSIGTYTTFDYIAPAGVCGFNITGTSGTTANVFAFLGPYRNYAPAAGTNGPIDDPTTAAAFTQEAILHYSQYAHLRLMGYSFTIVNCQVGSSATRSTPANTQARRDFGLTQNPTFTGSPASGATSATLSAAWPYPSGSYVFPFISPGNHQARICTLTNGATTCTWTNALTENTTSSSLNGAQSREPFPIEWMVAFAKACNIGLWISTPMVEDGTNSSAGGWSSSVMDYLVANWNWASGKKIYFELANENWNVGPAPWFVYVGLSAVYGFATRDTYYAYLLHAFANLCRTKFPTTFGTQVNQVFAWQTVGQFYENSILTALAAIGTPSADVQYIATAPYCTPTVGNSDSIATIEAAVASAGAVQALNSNCENTAIQAMYYGIKLCGYESGGQWGIAPVSQTNANVGLAIMDAGMTAPLTTYYQGVFNSGFEFITHFGSGVSASGNANTSPTYELSNVYASPLSSPTLSALQSFMSGFTPTRNVVSGSGSVINGVNYADNSAALPSGNYGQASNLPGAFNLTGLIAPFFLSGYVTYLVNCTAPGGYTLVVNFTVTGTKYTDLIVNGVLLQVFVTVTTGNVSLGSVTLKKGPNFVLLGRGSAQASVAVNSLTFN